MVSVEEGDKGVHLFSGRGSFERSTKKVKEGETLVSEGA